VPEVLTTAQAADASNAPFTADEQATISSNLGDVKQLMREQFGLTAEQLAAIDQRYLLQDCHRRNHAPIFSIGQNDNEMPEPQPWHLTPVDVTLDEDGQPEAVSAGSGSGWPT
jgi:hypothetical protein